MYTVYLADDEQLIREGLSETVPWEALGLKLIGTAENGKQALRGIQAGAPDIVLTDIQMPHLSGLELIEKIRQSYEGCRIIIITGYSEFSYAQSAIRLGVSDFVVKPIDIPALCGTLTRIVDELDRIRNKRDEVEKLRIRLQHADEYRYQQLLLRYMTGRITRQTFLEQIPVQVKRGRIIGLILLQIDNFDNITSGMDEESIFGMTQQMEFTIEKLGGDSMIIIEEPGGRYILLFFGEQEEDLRFELRSFVRRLRLSETQIAFTTVTSQIYPSVEDCCTAYSLLKKGVHYAFQLGGNRDIHADDAAKDSSDPLSGMPNAKRVLQSIASFNKNSIRRDFELLSKDIQSTGHNSYLYSRMLVGIIYNEIGKLMIDIGCPIESVVKNPLESYQKILTCTTLRDMLWELYRFIEVLCDFINRNSRTGKSTVERAKIYIEAHYADSSLTLDRVACEMGISPNYFSALFKQCTQISFINYLTSVRIGHAKKLLASKKYKTYEVANQCGYENPTYFSTIFKRHTGVSPSEYKEG
ncbi:response regulator [Clostridiaceae bacterium]|nr:response regulator [Clostridiaceae bacterium]